MTKDFYYFFFIPFYFEGKLQTDILKKYLIKKNFGQLNAPCGC